jgi:phenylpyruvate tautomerase PptA (4-oxalocrotonate tautomerase family)
MPLVHISLLDGKPKDYLDTLADGVHQAMVEAFEVPPDDRFQTIRQFAVGELHYDAHYLGGPRSTDFVLVEITAGRPRSTATKEAFYRRLAERLQASPGLRPADLMVVIATTQRDEWSFGDGLATLLQPTTS